MEIVISFIEILGMFLIHNVLFNNSVVKDIAIKILHIIISISIYSLFINFYKVNNSISFVTIIFLNCLLLRKLYNKRSVILLSEFIISVIIIYGFEFIILFLIQLFFWERHFREEWYLLIILLGVISLIVIVNKILKNKEINISKIFYENKIFNVIALNILILLMFIRLMISIDVFKSRVIIESGLLVILLVSVNLYFIKYLINMNRTKRNKEIWGHINPLLEQLMEELKSNDHEYKNYITTISGIVQVSNPEEMAINLEKYIDKISIRERDISRLLYIDNIIVRAIIYSAVQKCEALFINFNYYVSSNLKKISLDESELTIILSNLLNNAIEATSKIEKKAIDIVIYEDINNYIIDIKNNTENFNIEKLQDVFKDGYSTKGENRGYGLSNVRKIVNKHRGKTQISLEDNIFNLIVFLPKKT